ncbi:sensor histidine kinase [Thiohalocapsa halophila]|nr:HAMP domain-containing sensor histidine kinase [Thiohalocapsa halophila]
MRQRLLLPLTLVFVLASLLGWWAASELVGRALRLRQQALVVATAEQLAGGQLPLTPELLTRLGALVDAQILLLDSRAPASLPQWLPALPSPARAPEAPARPMATPHADGTLNLRINGAPHLVALRPLPPGLAHGADHVAVINSLADLEAAIYRAAQWLALAALVSIALLLAVATALTDSIARSLAQLSTMARRIADGNRSVRMRALGPPELRSLTCSLNEMVARLDAYERRAAEQAKLAGLGAMAARVAHEVRNPLTAIKLQLQLRAESGPGGQEPDAVDLVAEIRRLELLLGGLLEQARPRRLHIAAADLNAVAGDVARLFEPQLAHAGITLAVDLAPTLPPAVMDVDGCKQILTNLLVNARDALGRGGRVTIATGPAHSAAVFVSISDDGSGLPDALAAALIAGDRDTLGAGGRVGLRLSLELAERMGARLATCESELGGACLRLRLPRAAPHHQEEATWQAS